MHINLHDFLARSTENGPGTRAVVWVQGCTLGCSGCFNPATHDTGIRQLVPVKELAAKVLAIPDNEGVTISGGEPFLQAEALAELGRRMQDADLGVLMFSGFSYETLSQSDNPAWKALLEVCDLLIAGPFVQELACSMALRGSSNQTLHYLSERYRGRQAQLEHSSNSVEILIDENGQMLVTGFPVEGFWETPESTIP